MLSSKDGILWSHWKGILRLVNKSENVYIKNKVHTHTLNLNYRNVSTGGSKKINRNIKFLDTILPVREDGFFFRIHLLILYI